LTIPLAQHAAWVTAIEPKLDWVGELGERTSMANRHNVTVWPGCLSCLPLEPHDVVLVVDWDWQRRGCDRELARALSLATRVLLVLGWRDGDLGALVGSLEQAGLAHTALEHAFGSHGSRALLAVPRSAFVSSS
jgi:hypothetical protein